MPIPQCFQQNEGGVCHKRRDPLFMNASDFVVNTADSLNLLHQAHPVIEREREKRWVPLSGCVALVSLAASFVCACTTVFKV